MRVRRGVVCWRSCLGRVEQEEVPRAWHGAIHHASLTTYMQTAHHQSMEPGMRIVWTVIVVALILLLGVQSEVVWAGSRTVEARLSRVPSRPEGEEGAEFLLPARSLARGRRVAESPLLEDLETGALERFPPLGGGA